MLFFVLDVFINEEKKIKRIHNSVLISYFGLNNIKCHAFVKLFPKGTIVSSFVYLFNLCWTKTPVNHSITKALAFVLSVKPLVWTSEKQIFCLALLLCSHTGTFIFTPSFLYFFLSVCTVHVWVTGAGWPHLHSCPVDMAVDGTARQVIEDTKLI